MKNTMLPQEDVANLREVIEKVNAYIEGHESLNPNLVSMDDKLQRIHILLYMDVTKDLIRSAKMVEHLLDCTPEEFEKNVTDDGAISLEEAENRLMTNLLMNLVLDK